MGRTASRSARRLEEGQLHRHAFALRRAYDSGREEFGPLPLSYDRFARRYLALTCRRFLASGVKATARRIGEMLARAAGGDVFLAMACDQNVEGAWETFRARYVRPMRGFLWGRGASSTEAEDVANDLLGELASPPANGETRTRFGRFDGSASLFSWLAVICLRRLVDRRRAARVRPVTAVLEDKGDGGPGPSERAVANETSTAFRAALATVWPSLTRQEILTLLWKYRDGLSQKRIAELFGVGPPRVSRVLARAIDKLKAQLPAHFGSSDWAALCRALHEYLETSAGPPESPGEEPLGHE